MRIWELNYDVDKYDNLATPGITDMPEFDGTSRIAAWKPLTVVRMQPKKRRPLGDAPSFARPIYSRRAVEVLSDVMGSSVEILPLNCSEGEFFAINIVDVLDAIDYDKSEYETFDDGRIMRFEKYSFLPDVVRGKNIFKIKDRYLSNGFVSDEFKRVVEENGLKGFKLKLAWEE